MIKLKSLIISIAISLGVGTLAGLLTMKSSKRVFETINQPALTPPQWVFPVVWAILFILMGVSAYLVYESRCVVKKPALWVYAIQLFLNFIWTLIFFNLQAFGLCIIIILALWVMIIAMIVLFYKCRPLAGYLQIPYLLWVTFATYLNIMIYLLN